MVKAHELRWHPLLKEWIIVAGHRGRRPWRPEEKKFFCPFCPGAPEVKDMESWDVIVLPNKFPALTPNPPKPSPSRDIYLTAPAKGVCEVIIETPSHEGDLCDLDMSHAKKVIEVFAEEYKRLGEMEFVKYVMIFRNKGKEIGVSLTHPHSQIYALNFIPPKIMRELESCKEYMKNRNKCLICNIIDLELEDSRRLIYENKHFIIFLPFFAMWPYETHIIPKRHVQSLTDLSDEEKLHLADALRIMTATYNRLFDFSMPYILVFHQKPTDGEKYEYYHLHLEFYPPYRERDKLKYAAGIEWGAGTFTYDGIPEEKASELRKACHKALRDIDHLGKIVGRNP